MTPIRDAKPQHARIHLRRADEYLGAASDSLAAGRYDAATSDAVVAAIRAADAICAVRLRQRWSSADHSGAVDLLGRADPDGQVAAPLLNELMPLKSKAQYGLGEFGYDEATATVELAARLLQMARAAVQSLPPSP